MTDLFGQGDFDVRLDWGPAGAHAARADVSVVVDVFSFSTSVCIAVERGMRVYPFPWEGEQAAIFAKHNDAFFAVGRLEATKDGAIPAPSLSPAGLLACEPYPRLVMPSPNGSTIATALLETGTAVAAGCVRNAEAVAKWLAPSLERGQSVAIIAAGERWAYDDSLRPALEDHLGAGAILWCLSGLGYRDKMSPEAIAAADLFDGSRESIAARLRDCVSGKELTSKSFVADVEAAADLNASTIVPILVDGSFGPAA